MREGAGGRAPVALGSEHAYGSNRPRTSTPKASQSLSTVSRVTFTEPSSIFRQCRGFSPAASAVLSCVQLCAERTGCLAERASRRRSVRRHAGQLADLGERAL